MDFVTTLMGILVGGGLFAFIQFLITRHDNKHDALQGIKIMITTISDKVDAFGRKSDERYAISVRVRILRFRDEMLAGQSHTHDSFQQVLSDIDAYEDYCNNHPEFRNNQTEITIEHIKSNYHERLEKHDFLQ